MDRQDADYDHDFYAWTQAQAAAIRRAGASRVNADVDWENVAEEIESLGRSDFRSVRSHLETIIEHLLKLMVSPASDPRRGWRRSVGNARIDVETYLTRSLHNDIEPAIGDIYHTTRRKAARGLIDDDLSIDDLPDHCPWTLDQLLDEEFWPENRHGLA